MTEDTKDEQVEEAAADMQADDSGDEKKKDPVRRWVRIFTAITAGLFVWYLFADRLTPFSSQGRVNAFVIPIAPEVSGTVESVSVANNQVVSAGQELIKIDRERYLFKLSAAKANLEQIRNQKAAQVANVDAARANVKSAKANFKQSRQDADRLQRIYDEDSGAISVRLLQSSQATLESSRAQVTSAEANLESAIETLGQPGDENPQIIAAKADVDTAQINYDRAIIRAPNDGLVTDVIIEKGNFAAQGQPLMTFVAIQDVWVQADMTENNISHIKPGNKVEIVFDVQPGRVVKGKIRSVGYGVQGAESTSTPGQLPTIQNERDWLRDAQRFPVLIDIDSSERLSEIGLRAGGRADVIVFTGSRPILNTLGRIYIRIKGLLSYAY